MSKTRKITTCAILTAIAVVVAVFTIKFGDIFELSLAPVVVMLASVLLGPVYGACCGVAADFLGTLFIGTGYNPIFAITWVLYGILPALFIKKLPVGFPKSLLTVTVTQVVCSVLLNSLWIYIFYGAGFTAVRLIGSFSSLGIYIVLFYFLQKLMARVGKKARMN